jgi:PhnB protein
MEQTVTPYLLYEDGEDAIDFLVHAFGFDEISRSTGAAGGLHAELQVAPEGGRIYLGQRPGGSKNATVAGCTSHVYILVDDVDGHFVRAKRAGARTLEELGNMPSGHRRYGCADPQGHEWYFAQPIAQGTRDG